MSDGVEWIVKGGWDACGPGGREGCGAEEVEEGRRGGCAEGLRRVMDGRAGMRGAARID